MAASSAARTLVAVRGLHKFLALEGETAHNPAQDVAPPAPPSRLPKAIGRDEVVALRMSFNRETLAAIRQARGCEDRVLPDATLPSAA